MPHFAKDGRGSGGQTAKSKVNIRLSGIPLDKYETQEDSKEKGVFDTIYDQIADIGASDDVEIGSDLDDRLHEIERALLRQDTIQITKDDHPDVIRAFKSRMRDFSKAEQEGLKKLQKTIDRSI